MKKTSCFILLLVFCFALVACDNSFDTTLLDGIWTEEFADSDNNVSLKTLKDAKVFYDGEYVDVSTKLNKRKDVKYEFMTSNSFRFVNSPEEYAITLPSKNVEVDYSLSGYRVQLAFNDSVLTVSRENKSPYGGNASGWNTYMNEWLIRYIDNPDYLDDNNLSYTHPKVVTTTMISGYEIILYGIVINDNSKMIPITLIDNTMAMATATAIIYATSDVLMPWLLAYSSSKVIYIKRRNQTMLPMISAMARMVNHKIFCGVTRRILPNR